MDKNAIDLMSLVDPVTIKIQLLKKGIKQKDIARKANVSKSAVCKVISGATISKRILQIIQEMIGEEA